jgi:hypothetical protein
VSSNNIEMLYYLRDAAACLGVLVGLVGAIVLLIRHKTAAGILALLGFLVIALEPLTDIVAFRILGAGSSPNWDALNSAYACVSGLSLLLGLVLLAAGLFVISRKGPLPPPAEPPTA